MILRTHLLFTPVVCQRYLGKQKEPRAKVSIIRTKRVKRGHRLWHLTSNGKPLIIGNYAAFYDVKLVTVFPKQ